MHLATAQDAAALFAPLFVGRDAEFVAAAYLDDARRLIGMTQSPGEQDRAALAVRRIIGEALKLEATGLILAHNHPSGDARPSDADIEATRHLSRTAAAVGVRLYDHLIFAGHDCRSLRALGLL